MTKRKIKPERLQEIHEVKDHFRQELLANPDVTSIGIGYREKGGKRTKELCLIVTVHKKLARKDVDPSRMLPKKLTCLSRLRGKELSVMVDIQESGIAVSYECGTCDADLDARVRPVPGGYNISGPPGGGTLGGWLWDNVNEEIVLISNNHVLGGAAGSNIYQPGGTIGANKIAEVVRTGTLDATVGSTTGPDIVDASIECSGPAVFEITEPTLDMQVEKVGQTTSLTCGTITQVGVDRGHYGSTNDFRVDTDDPTVRFAYYGDSGSLIVERAHPEGSNWKRVVGLLWGGIPAEYNAFAHPMGDVFADLDLTTVCAGILSQLFDSMFASSTTFAKAPRVDVVRKSSMMTKGIGRDLEKRLLGTKKGKQVSKLLHENRADIVELLLDRDGWRATVAALHPLVTDKVTTHELLQHKLTRTDIQNLQRVVDVMQEKRPELKAVLKVAKTLLRGAVGRNVGSLFSE